MSSIIRPMMPANNKRRKAPTVGSLSNLQPRGWLGARAVVALQSWAVVVVLRSGTGAVRRCVGGAAAQGRTVSVRLVILDLVLVLEGCQARLDLVELRGVHDVLLTRRQHGGHLLLGVGNPVGGHGVRGEGLGDRARLLLFLR